MRVDIVIIGDEILSGETYDSNSHSIVKKLTEIGIKTGRITLVGDIKEEISSAVKSALRKADIVFTVGGLGMTGDDITKQVIAELLNKKMEFNAELMEEVKAKYRKICMRKLTESMKGYGDVPAGSVMLPNSVGISPGILITKGKKSVIMLPGPPRELNAIIDEGIIPYLEKTLIHASYLKRIIRTTGTGEINLYEILKPVISRWRSVSVSFLPNLKGVTIVLRMKNIKNRNAGRILDEKQKEIVNHIKKYVYSLEDIELSEAVSRELIKKNLTISTAESCTGGSISSALTDISGSSAYFMNGVVCYSNESKIKILGVPKDIIEKYGAVSPQTARAMAENVRKISKTDIGISTTGVFGPTGGTQKKPVGLVYIGYADKNGTSVFKHNFGKKRERNKIRTTQEALNLVRKKILR
ncbi:competence/damage-inducible protein A [candidate division KSB1 bacterium]